MIQRRILLVGNDSQDYATLKVLYNIVKSEGDVSMVGRGQVYPYNNFTAPGLVGQQENIFIVGHGYPGGIWTQGRAGNVDLEALGDDLFEVIPEDWEGEIRVLTCRSGVADEDVGSVATQISVKLQEYNLNVKVRGTTGFSYGTPQTASSGLTSVLDPKFDEFYKGGYTKSMAKEFSAKAPVTDRRKKLAKDKNDKKFTEPTKAGDAAKAWVFVRDAIENDLKTVVATASNDGARNVTATLTELLTTNKKEWEALLAEQEKEFTTYGMFADSKKGFVDG